MKVYFKSWPANADDANKINHNDTLDAFVRVQWDVTEKYSRGILEMARNFYKEKKMQKRANAMMRLSGKRPQSGARLQSQKPM